MYLWQEEKIGIHNMDIYGRRERKFVFFSIREIKRKISCWRKKYWCNLAIYLLVEGARRKN